MRPPGAASGSLPAWHGDLKSSAGAMLLEASSVGLLLTGVEVVPLQLCGDAGAWLGMRRRALADAAAEAAGAGRLSRPRALSTEVMSEMVAE